MKHYFFILILNLIIASTVYSQKRDTTANSFSIEQVLKLGSEYDLVKSMPGTWKVEQRIWPKAGAEPILASPFIAHRQMVGHFLEETMEAKPGTGVELFTRKTYLNYNYANLHWEHIVLDTRYPVMMFETSYDGTIKNGKEITLYLPAFIIPPAGWDKEIAGKLGKQRRTITIENPDLNIVRQYWTPPGGKEFLAIEYIYKRQR